MIRSASGLDRTAWDAYVGRDPAGTCCHLAGWTRAVERTWGHRSCALYAERAGAVVGVLPLMQVRSAIFGSMLVSTPAAIYGGALADDAAARGALIAEAGRLARRLGVDYLELRDARPLEYGPEGGALRQRDLYVTFERPIADDEAALLGSLPKKIRYQVRRARAVGLTAEVGREELLDDFYEVYAANMRGLGTPVYPKRLFGELLRAFPSHSEILIVRLGQRAAGATLSFFFRDGVLPHYGCARAELHRTGVSAFLYWELMRRAAARGCRHFDFGRSKLGSGSWAFKRGWRMAERPLPYRYLLVRAAALPNLNPTNPKFRLAIEAWKRLPLGLTKLVGPPIVKYIP